MSDDKFEIVFHKEQQKGSSTDRILLSNLEVNSSIMRILKDLNFNEKILPNIDNIYCLIYIAVEKAGGYVPEKIFERMKQLIDKKDQLDKELQKNREVELQILKKNMN